MPVETRSAKRIRVDRDTRQDELAMARWTISRFLINHVDRFLRKDLFGMSMQQVGLHVPQHVYNTCRLLHVDDEADRRLFYFWNPDKGEYSIEWHRVILTQAIRVTFDEPHVPGCDGKRKLEPTDIVSAISEKLATRCGCPVKITSRRVIWMAMPRALSSCCLYDMNGRLVWTSVSNVFLSHGQPVVPSEVISEYK